MAAAAPEVSFAEFVPGAEASQKAALSAGFAVLDAEAFPEEGASVGSAALDAAAAAYPVVGASVGFAGREEEAFLEEDASVVVPGLVDAFVGAAVHGAEAYQAAAAVAGLEMVAFQEAVLVAVEVQTDASLVGVAVAALGVADRVPVVATQTSAFQGEGAAAVPEAEVLEAVVVVQTNAYLVVVAAAAVGPGDVEASPVEGDGVLDEEALQEVVGAALDVVAYLKPHSLVMNRTAVHGVFSFVHKSITELTRKDLA